jgi:hypothetical protein
MTLRTELQTDPAGMGYNLADLAAVEALINARTRTRPVPTEVGTGTILEVLGLDAGNALLDVIYNDPKFRYVKPLVEQGRLRLDLPLTAATMGALAQAGVITLAQAESLLARAYVPASRGEELGLGQVTDTMIREALA